MQSREAAVEQNVVSFGDAEAGSPFLPGTCIQYAWDSTSLGWAKTCPRLYQYCMIEGWRPKEENVHLRFGIEYHKALEQYDQWRAKGIDHGEALHNTIDNLVGRLDDYEDPDPDSKRSIKIKTKAKLIEAVAWYLEKYQDDPAQTYIRRDGTPCVEQSFRFELNFGPEAKGVDQPYLLCGHLDRVVNFNDDLYVMDRKTTTTTPGNYYFQKYEPDNQMTLYTFAGQVILKSPIKGVIIDVAYVTIGSSEFVRGITYRSKDQIEEWLRDLQVHLRTFEEYAVAEYWPQNDTACDKYGGCRFRDVCSRSPSVRHAFLKTDFNQEDPWNPLKTR